MNFYKALLAERLKFHRSPVYLAFMVLTLLAAVLGTANYANNLEVLQSGWYSLWSQHTLFACSLFLPGELAVLCAWQWRLEHSDHCWNRLMTAPIAFVWLYLAKLCWAALISLAAVGFTLLCYLVGGIACGLPLSALPPQTLGWVAGGVVGCVVVAAWQELLSMLIRSFPVPVAAALVAGIGGLLLMAKGFGFFWPWSLLSLGMRANNPQMALDTPRFAAAALLFTLLPTIAGLVFAAWQDVRSE